MGSFSHSLHVKCAAVACQLTVVTLLAGCQNVSTTGVAASTEAVSVPEVQPADSALGVAAIEPLPLELASPPTIIEIPAVGLMAPVAQMEWEITESAGRRTTVWKVPTDAAGWHLDSAGAGGAGNMLISGHQAEGSSVFKPLSLGSVQIGQEVLVTDEVGNTFVYRVSEVSKPISLDSPTTQETEAINQYYASNNKPTITMITGWPDFTTTHRLFIVAELVGQL